MTVIRNDLDKRIKDFSDIQSYTQYDDKYVGETGYFSDDITSFKDLCNCEKSVLKEIYGNDDDDLIFMDEDSAFYRFFLPESLLKVEYRPFTKDEFIRMFNNGVFGQWITLKNIIDNKESCFQIVGYFHAPDDTFAICFGSHEFSLQTLFNYYRWKDSDGNWRVFGVEVKEE